MQVRSQASTGRYTRAVDGSQGVLLLPFGIIRTRPARPLHQFVPARPSGAACVRKPANSRLRAISLSACPPSSRNAAPPYTRPPPQHRSSAVHAPQAAMPRCRTRAPRLNVTLAYKCPTPRLPHCRTHGPCLNGALPYNRPTASVSCCRTYAPHPYLVRYLSPQRVAPSTRQPDYGTVPRQHR